MEIERDEDELIKINKQDRKNDMIKRFVKEIIIWVNKQKQQQRLTASSISFMYK